MGTADRRVYARMPASFKVDYVHKDNYFISFNRDLSVDGMFVCTENPPVIGSHITLIFSVGKFEGVEIPALVVWVNQKGPKAERGMGVQFLGKPPTVFMENILQAVNRIVILQDEIKYA
ncbi:MAG: hypothetical protein A2521_11545 [Deltaproteobacteria bacterium RIFOXYD12_FULL_57_12]|nr:MAG: hypothetical protein A2521_11545 [Deltaproteobacteria bacterium RIFOXYD12_FULL_57_12]